ncbi:hypothetical protein [Pseudomonas pseudonitroreducens]|uniref:hypothetical protein n=1 Tax=Pseudomonas pseudonitroreducens TaxID=2892326 RepID=UPI001F481F83|nr:hypothetical protein [Pseudomonas pseudonitroreducens]
MSDSQSTEAAQEIPDLLKQLVKAVEEMTKAAQGTTAAAQETAKAAGDFKSSVEKKDKKAEEEKSPPASHELRGKAANDLESERRAIGAQIESERKSGGRIEEDWSPFAGYFGKVLTQARTPLAGMSSAALAEFDKRQGITNSGVKLDTSSLDKTNESLQRALEAYESLKGATTVGMTSLGKWVLETQTRSAEVQVQFLSQKKSLQDLLEGYQNGSMELDTFVKRASSARAGMKLLDSADLKQLESAIAAAREQIQQLRDASQQTLSSMKGELAGLRGDDDEVERLNFVSRRDELQKQLAQAQKSGDSRTIQNTQSALSTLRQIQSETDQQRQQAEQKSRLEQVQPATAQLPAPSKVIRLESAAGSVDVAVRNDGDEARLLGILEQVGRRTF